MAKKISEWFEDDEHTESSAQIFEWCLISVFLVAIVYALAALLKLV